MFTGIVEEVGKVISLTDAQVQDGSFRLTVGAAKVLDGLRLGGQRIRQRGLSDGGGHHTRRL